MQWWGIRKMIRKQISSNLVQKWRKARKNESREARKAVVVHLTFEL
jgi:hypothetical protein